MSEIIRSRLYYARARVFTAIPTVDDSEISKFLRVLLTRVVKKLKSFNNVDILNSSFSVNEQEAGPFVAGVLQGLLDRDMTCGHEYFGRVWTLAERLARCSWEEGLRNWISLDLWLGMVLDAFVNTSENPESAELYWSKLFSEDGRTRLSSAVSKLRFAIEAGGSVEANPELVDEVCVVLIDAVHAWFTGSLKESPTKKWLASYLQHDMLNTYLAFEEMDGIFAVYGYYCTDEPDYECWRAAFTSLVKVVGTGETVDDELDFKRTLAKYREKCATIIRRSVLGADMQRDSSLGGGRANQLLPQPASPKYKLCHVGFTTPGGPKFNLDKDKNGYRFDAVPICNGVINAGASCDLIQYDADKHDEFAAKLESYDAFIVRVNPGQLSAPGVCAGAQERFDTLMTAIAAKGKPVWSSSNVQTCMGAKSSLAKITKLSCGLVDNLAYYNAAELEVGFKKTVAFQPRVIKQNRGHGGEGVWMCWLEDKEYVDNYGYQMLEDSDRLKLMEMNDNHCEYHTVAEFLEFCINGRTEKAGTWISVSPGKYMEGGEEAGGIMVDHRLLPVASAVGEVHMTMVKDKLFQTIHRKPNMICEYGTMIYKEGSKKTYYGPGDSPYSDLEAKFVGRDVPLLMEALDIADQPLPLLWTVKFLPMDWEEFHWDGPAFDYTAAAFDCSVLGISKFSAACGPEKCLADVTDVDFAEGMRLTNLMGVSAVETLDEMKMMAKQLPMI
ncbi:hypothetical protein CYMTET_23305 [Cymbomonas tetramitiformis]|uniref:DUF6815 domain-containing protein n=1 Tax=Cymbomonas tetramitiformis TaxID=36881 RepID=A0AAE0FY58_9CHLO|nr:hypothetical protein CYMTET_23305 [Cymbomonas tetramitiformis]